jgi:DNA-directed RNA polymerase subunit RPC12/RpoP
LKIYRSQFIVINAVNGSNFQIEQQCPQCGAPIIIDETDRILSCKFCRTRVYLATEDHLRFYIPPAEGIPETIYFIPYWRLRDFLTPWKKRTSVFLIRYFDANFLSFDLSSLPYSLGLRPQAMKLKFVGSNENV